MVPASRVCAASLLLAVLCLLPFEVQSSASTSSTSAAHNSAASSQKRAKRPAWHNGPASMPPDTEIVPPRPSSVPPTLKTLTPPEQTTETVHDGAGSSASPQPRSVTTRAPAGAAKPGLPMTTGGSADSGCRDLARGSLAALHCLRIDPSAREAFYDELRRTVQEVRAGDHASRSAAPRP